MLQSHGGASGMFAVKRGMEDPQSQLFVVTQRTPYLQRV